MMSTDNIVNDDALVRTVTKGGVCELLSMGREEKETPPSTPAVAHNKYFKIRPREN